MTAGSLTIAVTIDVEPATVADFVADPANLAAWAKGVDTGAAVVFVEPNPYGVLDHRVRPAPDTEVYVPMRVVPRGTGSEVLFTILTTGATTDEGLAADADAVKADLARLKSVLEAATTPRRSSSRRS